MSRCSSRTSLNRKWFSIHHHLAAPAALRTTLSSRADSSNASSNALSGPTGPSSPSALRRPDRGRTHTAPAARIVGRLIANVADLAGEPWNILVHNRLTAADFDPRHVEGIPDADDLLVGQRPLRPPDHAQFTSVDEQAPFARTGR